MFPAAKFLFLFLLPLLQSHQILLTSIQYAGSSLMLSPILQLSCLPTTPTTPTTPSHPSTPLGQSHPYRLTPIYSASLTTSKSLPKITNIVAIATLYFRKTLKVQYLQQSQVLYRRTNRGTCDSTIPKNFITYGFDQEETDTIVAISDIRGKGEGGGVVNAQAIYCLLTRRVVYAEVKFNLSQVGRTFLEIHSMVQVTVHEIMHVLGVSANLFKHYFTNSTAYTRKPLTDVLKKLKNRHYIISPKVLQHVSKYFNCHDGTGALLQNKPSPGHWDPFVFHSEYMTPTRLYSGLKITRLTLSLLEDTGFYSQVSYEMAERTGWGEKKGCEFARGRVKELMPCKERMCDVTGRYVQQCAGKVYSDGRFGFGGRICEEERGVENGSRVVEEGVGSRKSSSVREYFGYQSRCFDSSSRSFCYKSYCSWDGKVISIEVGNQTGYCYKTYLKGRMVKINGVWLRCPENFQAFCDYKGCKRFCSGKGLCIDGKCMCREGYYGEDCSKQ